MSQELFGHVFTTYDEMIQESIDWYARGLKEFKAIKRKRERDRRKAALAAPPNPDAAKGEK